jgi:N-acetylmuramoyl-L-alanine amidase
MKIKNHRLCFNDGQKVPYKASPNRGTKIDPKYLIMHYTAGRSFESSVSWLTNPLSRASAHLVIGRNGEIQQLVPFNVKAWHAGRSEWNNISGLNAHSIGIELDNAGKMMRHMDKWRAWFGEVYEEDEVIEAIHKHDDEMHGWQVYTSTQLEVAAEIAALLVDHYKLEDVLGHDDISPFRKMDPGPAFPMMSFRSLAVGREDDDGHFHQTVTYLNIRLGPATEYDRLDISPLPPKTKVEILDSFEAWKFVEVMDPIQDHLDIRGWVHGRYLKPVKNR